MRNLVVILWVLSLVSISCGFVEPHLSKFRHRQWKQAQLAPLAGLEGRSIGLHPGTVTIRAATGADNDGESSNAASPETKGIDVGTDPRLYRLTLSRATGIEWGTDLSFAFVYVRAMDPTGAAAMSGQISVGDQLCEIRPLCGDESQLAPVNLIGAPFDFVMNAFAGLDKTVKDLDLVLFKGTKDELKALAAGDGSGGAEPETVTITVIQNKGAQDEQTKTIIGKVGCNLRQILVDNEINVYQSFTRWTNCKGKQLCGTCIVNVTEGSMNTNRKSMDEASTLRENPDSYRISCVTFAYGDVSVETFPPINAAQWTR